MKTAEELLANKDLSFFDMSNKGVWEEVKAVINEARKEAIEECAENAKIIHHDGFTKKDKSIDYFQSGQDNIKADKQAILNLISQIK